MAQAEDLKPLVIDGKVKFPVASVNGYVARTVAQRDSLIAIFNVFAATSPVVVITFTPTTYQVNLATCALSLASTDEYEDGQTRQGVIPVVEKLSTRLNALTLIGGQAARRLDIQARLDYILSVAQSLP